MTDEFSVEINADIRPFAVALEELEELSDRFGRQLSGSFKSAIVSGKTLKDVLRNIGSSLAEMALNQGLKPLQSLASSLFSSVVGGLAGITPYAKGGVVPFASGGVVSAPTFFPAGGKLGLMGEAGAEAILPLQRGSDGRLGVAANGGGAAVNIVFNVAAPDPATFQKSEAQVSHMLARAVSRGLRQF
ncbi:MAG: phage tail tape measure protein [Rhizobiaceae bacterium]